MEERLQKFLSARGIVSRRAAERYIQDGRITVNGVLAQLGMKVDPDRDQIAVDGVLVSEEPPKLYLMLNKPQGYVSTLSDERGSKTAAELVGRLRRPGVARGAAGHVLRGTAAFHK